MKYLILIYTNPASREAWESFSDSDRAAGFQEYDRLTAELAASGELPIMDSIPEQRYLESRAQRTLKSAP